MGQFFQKIIAFWSGQTAWLVLVMILASLFIYGQSAGIRLLSTTPAETWSPAGSGNHSHNSGIHHK